MPAAGASTKITNSACLIQRLHRCRCAYHHSSPPCLAVEEACRRRAYIKERIEASLFSTRGSACSVWLVSIFAHVHMDSRFEGGTCKGSLGLGLTRDAVSHYGPLPRTIEKPTACASSIS